jgi:hypothetical protein
METEIQSLGRKHTDDYRNEQHPILNPREARQGVISGRILLILAASLGLAVVAGGVLAFTFF